MVGSSDDAQWFSWSHPDRPYVVQAFESRDDSNLQVVAVGAHFPQSRRVLRCRRLREDGPRARIEGSYPIDDAAEKCKQGRLDGGHECSQMYLKQSHCCKFGLSR